MKIKLVTSLILFQLTSQAQETLQSVTGRGNTTSTDVEINTYRIGKGASNEPTNFVIGGNSLLNSTGEHNLAIGHNILTQSNSAFENLGIGNDALRFITTGTENTAVGTYNLRAATTGSGNTAIGNWVAFRMTTGTENTGVGKNALQGLQTGNYNTGIGFCALTSNNTGSYNTSLGWYAGAFATGNYNTVIGARIKGTMGMSNTVILGDGADTENSIRFYSPANGNVGLGTTNPLEKLSVNGNILISNSQIPMGIISELPGTANPLINLSMNFREANRDISHIGAGFRIDSREGSQLFQWLTRAAGTDQEKLAMVMTKDGFVGINTFNPQEHLSVNGKIRAHEIKVETANWPDYVFTKEHQLPSLSEVESFIKTNRHLPEIPSAKQAEAEGVSLGEMNAKLLKKIEELTLYMIEMKKENEKRDSRIKELESLLRK